MAHEYESGFQVGEAAWHGLGATVKDAPSVEDGIRLAGLDWDVVEREVFARTPEGNSFACTDYKALIRASDSAVLGVVGADFTPLQNREAFAFFNPFLQDGQASLETAGSLRGGKRVYVTAKIAHAEDSVGKPDDRVRAYLLLAHAHDGTMAVTCSFTPIRVVCMNTLRAAMGRADSGTDACLKVKHTKNVKAGLEAVQRTIDLSRRTFAMTIEEYRAMAAVGVDARTARNYVTRVLSPDLAHKQDVAKAEMLAAAMRAAGGLDVDVKAPAVPILGGEDKEPRAVEKILAGFDGGARGASLAGHTVWGLYNAVTDWVDHERGRTPESRREASWFGEGARVRERAHREALALV